MTPCTRTSGWPRLPSWKRDGLESTPVPATIEGEEHNEYSYQFWNCSDGTESRQGSWASGTSPDGKGEFTYLEDPQPLAGAPTPPSPRPADMCNTGS
ncbi:hypothetical protein BH24ACT14_BH24ACT14_07940 [soil metagenome]